MNKKKKGAILILFIISFGFLFVSVMIAATISKSRANYQIMDIRKDMLYYNNLTVLNVVHAAIIDENTPGGSIANKYNNSNIYSDNEVLIGDDTGRRYINKIGVNEKIITPKKITVRKKDNSMFVAQADVTAIVISQNINGKKREFIKVKATSYFDDIKKSSSIYTKEGDRTTTHTTTMFIEKNLTNRPRIFDADIDIF